MTASILQSVSHTYWYLTFVCNIIAKICIGYMYNVHGTKNIHIGDWLIFPFSGSVCEKILWLDTKGSVSYSKIQV